MKPPTLSDHNLMAAEHALCVSALTQSGSIVEAAKLLGITRHALKRRIVKYGIRWSRDARALSVASPQAAA